MTRKLLNTPKNIWVFVERPNNGKRITHIFVHNASKVKHKVSPNSYLISFAKSLTNSMHMAKSQNLKINNFSC